MSVIMESSCYGSEQSDSGGFACHCGQEIKAVSVSKKSQVWACHVCNPAWKSLFIKLPSSYLRQTLSPHKPQIYVNISIDLINWLFLEVGKNASPCAH